ncbi:MAG: thioredoxin family protein [Nocardioidaceae bacterium]|nr:thioredoxin family protein [Nocardioidaceae bacterium]
MSAPAGGLGPDVSTGAWVVVVALVLASGFGVLRAGRDGRFRGTHRVRAPQAPAPDPAPETMPLHGLAAEPGERATLLQFSSAFCAPCRATRRVLDEVASVVPGVAHVEVDAEHHLDVVRRLGIVRTPTTLVLGADGREVSRATGAPTRADVLVALERAFG